MIAYQAESSLKAEEFINLLNKTTLGVRRPVDDVERIQEMLTHSNILITARDNDKLVGVARGISDMVYCTYLSDLAVDEAYQQQGIGKKLLDKARHITPKAKIILVAAPDAIDYYPKIGMLKRDHCYYFPSLKELDNG